MIRLEAKIRGFLSANLYFLSPEFDLIEVEYKLENAFGTRGFIDILAQDKFDNLVIIEIKRSNQAARQAIQEVLKYAGLLRQTRAIKESEIRICIVSTEWDELLVPFSEFSQITNYPLEGFKIYLNPDNIPESYERVIPLKNPIERKISHNQLVYLYQSHETLIQSIEKVKERVKTVGILDFVLLDMYCERVEDKIIYPFALYLAIQRYSKDRLEKITTEHLGIDDLEDIVDFEESEFEQIHSLEQTILAEIGINISDTREAGGPDILTSMINTQGWVVNRLFRNGLFNSDPRSQKNEILISEIQGTKGEWSTNYHNYTSSKFKLRLEQIKDQAPQYLWVNEFNDIWLKHVDFAFAQLEDYASDFELALDIFNPRSGILTTLYQMHNFTRFKAVHPAQFIPNYVLQIHLSDDNQSSIVYLGVVRWNGNKTTLDEIIHKSLNGDRDLFSYFFANQLGVESFTEFKIMKALGLEYSTEVINMQRGKIYNVSTIEFDEDDSIHLIECKGNMYLQNFFSSSEAFLTELTQGFNRFVSIS